MPVAHLLWIPLFAVLVGCGQPESPVSRQRLELTPIDAAGEIGKARLIQRIVMPSQLEGQGWGIVARRAQIIPVDILGTGKTASALHLVGDERGMHVRIPGSWDSSTFNEVTVTVMVRGVEDFSVALRHDGEALARSGRKRVEGNGQPVPLTFAFPDLEPRDIGEIVIEIPGHRSRGERIPPGEVALLMVELVHRSAAARLPDPSGPPRPVGLDGDWRPAVGLAIHRPLRSEFVAEPGVTLDFSFGGAVDAELKLTLSGGGKPRVETYPATDDGWTDVSVPLDDLAGRWLVARFDVSFPEGAPGAVALSTPALRGLVPEPRRVLLITSDTHRADHLGVAPRAVDVRTPFLDAMANRGLYFEDCMAASNLTNPGHAALMTGGSGRSTQVVNNFTPLSETAETLAEAFARSGFLTLAAVSVHHLGPEVSGLGQGFDRVSAPIVGQRDSTDTLECLMPWLDAADGQDVFVWLHIFDAHGPYDPPPAYAQLYYPADRDPYDPALPAVPADRLHDDHGGVRDLDYPAAMYRSEVTYLDDQLAGLLAQPRWRDATVAFTSDHGESMAERRIYFNHVELYPDVLSVPLILTWPGAEARRVATGVSYADLGRTLLDLAGLHSEPFPGRNLTHVVDGPASSRADEPRFALASDDRVAVIVIRDWMLMLHLKSLALDESRALDESLEPVLEHSHELYDRSADPEARNDVAAEHPEIGARLRAALIDWLVAAEPRVIRNRMWDEEMLVDLAALGYTEPAGATTVLFDPDCTCERCLQLAPARSVSGPR